LAKFVLIHGMFHGAWCWDRLLPELAARGHGTIVPNLAGCAGDPTPATDCTLERWAGDVAALIAAQDEPVIVVGHSRGGLVASQVAENAAEQVAASVYLAAVLIPGGTAMGGMADLLEQSGYTYGMADFPVAFSADGLYLLPPDADAWFHEGYSAADRAWSQARVAPEPALALGAPLRLSAERYGRIPRFYIETVQDRIMPLATQRALVMLNPPVEVLTLDTGHMPIVTHPAELADMLDAIARRAEV